MDASSKSQWHTYIREEPATIKDFFSDESESEDEEKGLGLHIGAGDTAEQCKPTSTARVKQPEQPEQQMPKSPSISETPS
ncbi:carcinoembryonic antigen-related cell adhesion molecule 5 [Plakobranchus ocellatus]|uniref:Carcinoembryonic antigen-related cell adhesion molecule 5 n=1 Tax=Plakobranchus ocellatus TaxID=259542 RepID=A0AAV3ZEY0_9GAST|nr:carcinoembryonic antigen-related cell adhesion molecule 5 [Plakobranchus ocellatus]